MDDKSFNLCCLQNKHLYLLKLLAESNERLNAPKLAEMLNVSVRSVYTYISFIKSNGIPIDSSKNGFVIEDKYKEELISNLNSNIRMESIAHARQDSIIKKLFLSGKPISIKELSNELSYSQATIISDVSAIRKNLQNDNINIIMKNKMLSLSGNESDLRKKMKQFLAEEIGDAFVNQHTIQAVFPNINIQSLETKIVTVISKHKYTISDYSLHNLCIHICIMLDRISVNKYQSLVVKRFNEEHQIDQEIINITKELFTYLSKTYNLYIDESEQYSIAAAISVNIQISGASTIQMPSANPKVNMLVDELVMAVKNQYDIVMDINFKNRFALHLEQWLAHPVRIRKNPLINDIKNSYPLLFDVSAFVADVISKKYPSLLINDYEISYIALHLGMSFESETHNNIKAILLTEDYYNLKDKLCDKIRAKFGNLITIVNSYISYRDIEKAAAFDLIITTNAKFCITDTEYVVITPFLNENDVSNLTKKIEKLLLHSDKSQAAKFLQCINNKCFSINERSNFTKTEIISEMCFQMSENNLVDDDFFRSTLEREELSSTSYKNFAIPHPFILSKRSTVVGIAIFKNEVAWDDKRNINIVILLSINESKKQEYRQIISYITNIFSSERWKENYKSINSYSDFVDFIIK